MTTRGLRNRAQLELGSQLGDLGFDRRCGSTQAKSVDESLKALVHHPYGAIVIGLVALGLLSYALFSFFDARLRRL